MDSVPADQSPSEVPETTASQPAGAQATPVPEVPVSGGLDSAASADIPAAPVLPPAADADPTAWQDTACELATELLPWLLKPGQCGDVYIGVLTSVVLAVPTALLGLALWLRRRRVARRVIPAAAPTLEPMTQSRLQGLLLGLPRWQDARARRRFITNALGKGHPLLNDIDCGGSARDAAFAVVDTCAGIGSGPGPEAAAAPICTLLAAIPREFGPDPARDAELAALRDLLGCT